MRKAGIAIVSLVALGGVALAQAGAPHFATVDKSDKLSSRVVGTDVTDKGDNTIGKIEDVVFDGSNAIKGYVLSVGGFLGMGSRYVVVDPASVKITFDENKQKWFARMDANKDQITNAPEFKYDGPAKASKN